MAFERITLDINANGEMPTFHCKQFDKGRPIIIDLVAGEDDYTPAAGVTFELQCRKVDMNLVVISDYEIDSNQITFASTEQLTACVGDNLATLKLFKDELEIATMNFIINVAIDPEAQGIVSDTVIDNLTTQIEEITEQVIGDNYYDKDEVDDLLDLKADAADVYTKTQVDTALALKADKATTYTKTETDTLLSDKADKSDTYTKAQVDSALSAKANTADLATVATTGDYDDLTNKPTIPAAQVQSDYAQTDDTKVDYIKNKPDINAMINDALLQIMPIGTASGSIANFETELALPLQSVTVNVEAMGGNGTPDNPIPINGYTEANITRCGKNLINNDNAEIGTAWNGASNSARARLVIPCEPSTNYILSMNGTMTVDGVYFGESETIPPSGIGAVTFPKIFTTANTSKYITLGFNKTNIAQEDIDGLKLQLEKGSTATAYEPYNGQTYTIAFGQTVYGGVLHIENGRTWFEVMWAGTKIKDLGWYYDSGFQRFYSTDQVDIKHTASDNDTPFILCDIYDVVAFSYFNAAERPNNSISNPIANGRINIRDTSFTDTASFIASVGEYYLAYELATPFDIDLTPVQISAIVGENNVSSDTNGDTTVQYKDSIQHYIDTRL